MPDLATLANVAEIFGFLVVIGGVIFALVQLSEFRRQRRDAAAAELMRSFYNPELAKAIRLVRELPDGVSARDMRALGSEYEEAAIIVCTTFETIGLVAFRGISPFSIVRDLTGGIAVVMWRKLARWCDDVRVEQSQPTWSEWFHWLADRLVEHTKEAEPAYRKYARWKPRG